MRVTRNTRWLEQSPTFCRCLLPAAILVTAAVVILAVSQFRHQERAFQTAAAQILAVQSRTIDAYLRIVASDVALLAGSALLRSLPPELDIGQRLMLERQLTVFAETRALYDQIRFIDAAGREVVRIDHRPEGAISAPTKDLQDKSDRYYVHIGLGLPPGEMFISPLDLNIERGAVEWPSKPTIRLVIPLFDLDGSRRGILVLNCLAELMLADLRRTGDVAGTPMLVNRRGYWLLAPNPDDEWGFMWAQRSKVTLAQRNPDLWSRIADVGSGAFVTTEGAYAFTTLGYRRIQPIRRVTGTILQPLALPLDAENEQWKLLLFLPRSQILDQTQVQILAAVGLALLCLATALCIAVAAHQPPPAQPPRGQHPRGQAPRAPQGQVIRTHAPRAKHPRDLSSGNWRRPGKP